MTAEAMAEIAALMGDAARMRMLIALCDHVELRASDLAHHANVSAQTTSFHLRKLCAARLLTVAKRGRSRVYALSGPEVAGALEALMAMAPDAEPRSRSASLKPIALARTCYDHLAGRLGVTLTDALLSQGWLEAGAREFAVTAKGNAAFAALGIDVEGLRGVRRQFAKRCLDWTERRYHVAGALGAAIADVLKRRKWIVPLKHSRAVHITGDGYRGLRSVFRVAL